MTVQDLMEALETRTKPDAEVVFDMTPTGFSWQFPLKVGRSNVNMIVLVPEEEQE